MVDQNQQFVVTVAELQNASAYDFARNCYHYAVKVSYEVAKGFTRPVTVEVHSDQALRALVLTVTTRIPPGMAGVDPLDRGAVERAVFRAFESAGWGPPRQVSAVGYATNHTGATGATSTWANFQWLTNVSGVSYEPEEYPPEPEPMWSPTAVYGFRTFRTFSSPGHPSSGLLYGSLVDWLGPRMTARCIDTQLSRQAKEDGTAPYSHKAPHWGCHCGLYITSDPQHYAVNGPSKLISDPTWAMSTWAMSVDDFERTIHVVALVRLSGTVIEHEHGARGEHAEIKVVWGEHQALVALQSGGRYPSVSYLSVPKFNSIHDLAPDPREISVEERLRESDTVREAVIRARRELAESMRDTRRKYIEAEEDRWAK